MGIAFCVWPLHGLNNVVSGLAQLGSQLYVIILYSNVRDVDVTDYSNGNDAFVIRISDLRDLPFAGLIFITFVYMACGGLGQWTKRISGACLFATLRSQ